MAWLPADLVRRGTARLARARDAVAAGAARSGDAVARSGSKVADAVRALNPRRASGDKTALPKPATERPSRRSRPENATPAATKSIRWLLVSAAALAAFAVVHAVDWIAGLYGRSPSLAIAATVAITTAVVAALLAARAELGALARLKSRVEIHDAFGTAGELPLDPAAMDALRGWLRDLPLTEGRAQILDLRTEDMSSGRIADLIEAQVLRDMDRTAVDRIRLGVLHSFGLIALSPTPITDTALFIWRAARLVREVAVIYGLRPSALGSLWLLRQVISDAALIAAADLATDAMATLLGDKLVARLSSPLAEGSLAAYRMARFGLLAIERCRPVPFSESEHKGLISVLRTSAEKTGLRP